MKIEDSTIGFIGLGGMGQRMARRLVDHGFHLTVFDRTAARMDGLKTAGATPSASLRTLATNSQVIISCLSNDAAVLEVYSGTRGVLAAAQPGTVVIEMSTVSPETSKTLFDLARERSVEVLDVTIPAAPPPRRKGLWFCSEAESSKSSSAARPSSARSRGRTFTWAIMEREVR